MIAPNPQTGMKPPPAPPRAWTNTRIAGNVLMALWAIAGISLAGVDSARLTVRATERCGPRVVRW